MAAKNWSAGTKVDCRSLPDHYTWNCSAAPICGNSPTPPSAPLLSHRACFLSKQNVIRDVLSQLTSVGSIQLMNTFMEEEKTPELNNERTGMVITTAAIEMVC